MATRRTAQPLRRTLGRAVYRLVSIGVTDDTDDAEAMNRRIITGATVFQAGVAPAWAMFYLAFDEPLAALAVSWVTVGGVLSLSGLWRFGRWTLFRRLNYGLWFLSAFAVMVALGGFSLGSAVIIWSVFGPMMAIMEGRAREAIGWVGAFVALVVLAGVVQPWLRESNNLPEGVRTTLFVMDLVMPTILIFLLLAYFVYQKEQALVVLVRNRELESAYLAQELNLRQSEKLATVGRLSAGLAHELNNPTAAAQQATQELSDLLGGNSWLRSELEILGLNAQERSALGPYGPLIASRVQHPEFLDPLERSDRAAAVQAFLEDIGVEEAWDVAPAIVDLGVGVAELVELKAHVRPDRLAAVATGVAVHFRRQRLLGALDASMVRIIELVAALKSYTFLDQAPRQSIDVHDGLDSTLVMFRNRLKQGVVVNRTYGQDVPRIEAFGAELNQVWTNIIDNAVQAMAGRGTIDITTRRTGDEVVIDITDSGPGISDEVAAQIFEPFVTTKPPGEGTGLGLNISYNIVTHKHRGEIEFDSRPGATMFRVRLPIVSTGDADNEGGEAPEAVGVPSRPGRSS